MPGEPVVLRTFLTAVDADMARSALEAAGIVSVVRSDDCGGMRPHLWMGGVELLVPADVAEAANAVLEELEARPLEPEPEEEAEEPEEPEKTQE